jgi:hypothetical protein
VQYKRPILHATVSNYHDWDLTEAEEVDKVYATKGLLCQEAVKESNSALSFVMVQAH